MLSTEHPVNNSSEKEKKNIYIVKRNKGRIRRKNYWPGPVVRAVDGATQRKNFYSKCLFMISANHVTNFCSFFFLEDKVFPWHFKWRITPGVDAMNECARV